MSAGAVVTLTLLVAAPLDAMSIRREYEFLGWSEDAKAFGSDFSAGGSPHPQTITAKECDEAMRQAREELSREKHA